MSETALTITACTWPLPEVIPTRPPLRAGIPVKPLMVHGVPTGFTSGPCIISGPVPVNESDTIKSAGGAAVVKDHTGPTVDPPPFRAVTRQRYVVLATMTGE